MVKDELYNVNNSIYKRKGGHFCGLFFKYTIYFDAHAGSCLRDGCISS